MNPGKLKRIYSLPALSLIGANLFPLFAVLFMGWDVYLVLFLYLAETGIIGAYGVIKLIIVAKFWSIFVIPLFVFAYAMIMMVPFAIIGGLSDAHFKGLKDTSGLISNAELLNQLKNGLMVYAFSHGVSFLFNYLGQKEYRSMTVEKQMIASYQRIILIFVAAFAGWLLYMLKETPLSFMGMVILFCLPPAAIFLAKLKNSRLSGSARPQIRINRKLILGFVIGAVVLAVLLISPAVSLLVFIIALKLGVDLYAHLAEHKVTAGD